MNELTKMIVKKTAMENKSLAKRNDRDFYWKVVDAHWTYLLISFGIDWQLRFMHLFSLWQPQLFDEEGYLKSYNNLVYDIEIEISRRVMKLINYKVDNTPELQLTEYGDYPQKIVKPQMELF